MAPRIIKSMYNHRISNKRENLLRLSPGRLTREEKERTLHRNEAAISFTDTAAILNLLDLRSIIFCPGALAVYLRALYGQKENFIVYFSEKRRSLLHPNVAQRSFFFAITIFF